MADWQIASPSRGCSECGREFAPGEGYHAQLFDEAAGFVRRDLCFSAWRGRVPDAEEEGPRLVDADLLMEFFTRLEGSPEPRKQQFRYILCLILMRKKYLKFTDVLITGETEWLVVEERADKSSHRVLDPKLSEDQIEALRGEIGRVLTGGDFDEELEAAPGPGGAGRAVGGDGGEEREERGGDAGPAEPGPGGARP